MILLRIKQKNDFSKKAAFAPFSYARSQMLILDALVKLLLDSDCERKNPRKIGTSRESNPDLPFSRRMLLPTELLDPTGRGAEIGASDYQAVNFSLGGSLVTTLALCCTTL